jgi:hypothetical protein
MALGNGSEGSGQCGAQRLSGGIGSGRGSQQRQQQP